MSLKQALALMLTWACAACPALSASMEKGEETEMNQSELEEYLYGRVKPVIEGWTDPETWAISFFVYSNECNVYGGRDNVTEFSVGFVTEKDIQTPYFDETERWNLPLYLGGANTSPILRPNNVDPAVPVRVDEGMEFLFDWYARNGIEDIGYESAEDVYDEDANYIGKGPVGYWEVLSAASNVGRRLQEEGVVQAAFGKPLPIIVHELDTYDLLRDVTEHANPHGEAREFLEWYDCMVEEARQEQEKMKAWLEERSQPHDGPRD